MIELSDRASESPRLPSAAAAAALAAVTVYVATAAHAITARTTDWKSAAYIFAGLTCYGAGAMH